MKHITFIRFCSLEMLFLSDNNDWEVILRYSNCFLHIFRDADLMKLESSKTALEYPVLPSASRYGRFTVFNMTLDKFYHFINMYHLSKGKYGHMIVLK